MRVNERIPLEDGIQGVVQQAKNSFWSNKNNALTKQFEGWGGVSGRSIDLIIDPKKQAEWEQGALKYSLKPVLSLSSERGIERRVRGG